MAEVHLLLGSNQGDRMKNLETAFDYLGRYAGKVKGSSQVYVTQPWGFECQELFYNQAVLLETEHYPNELLRKIKYIEESMGRKITQTNGYESRIIDIDILYYENLVIKNDPSLIIPHPRMAERRFVLEPLKQLDPEKLHPLSKKTSKEMLDECKDENFVIRL